jgi:hypothetical protein
MSKSLANSEPHLIALGRALQGLPPNRHKDWEPEAKTLGLKSMEVRAGGERWDWMPGIDWYCYTTDKAVDGIEIELTSWYLSEQKLEYDVAEKRLNSEFDACLKGLSASIGQPKYTGASEDKDFPDDLPQTPDRAAIWNSATGRIVLAARDGGGDDAIPYSVFVWRFPD